MTCFIVRLTVICHYPERKEVAFMRREIQLNLPSLDELTAQERTVTPATTSRSMNVIHVSTPAWKLKAEAYCRVSTDKIRNPPSSSSKSTSPRKRRSMMTGSLLVSTRTSYPARRRKKRPQLNRLLADCEREAVNLVLTKSISRFARNTTDLLEMVRSP